MAIMIGAETEDDACDRLTPFMSELTMRLYANDDIADVFEVEDLAAIIGEAFRASSEKMAQ